MLVIIAEHQDRAASALVARWAAHGAGLLTLDDLSVPGWRFAPTDPAASVAVVGGRRVAVSDIAGVLTRIPAVGESSLVQIDPADRSYVATEMQAFLVAWLSDLPCPVLNRPTPFCLMGPDWPLERWVHVAARAGLRVTPALRAARAGADGWTQAYPIPAQAGVTVTVVGRRHVGPVSPELGRQARDLAAAAGVELLAVRFDGAGPGSRFLDASLWPDIAADEVADALLARFQGR